MKKIYFLLAAMFLTVATFAQYSTLYENDFTQETTGTYHLGTELTPNPWTGLNFTNSFWKKENDNGLNFGNWRGVNLVANPLMNWVKGKKVKFTMGVFLNLDNADQDIRCGLVVAAGAETVVPKVGFEILSYAAATGMQIKVGESTFTTDPVANGTLVTMEYEVTRSDLDGQFSTILIVKNGATPILNETVVCTDTDLYNNAINGNNSVFTCYNKATNDMAFWSFFKLEMESSVVLIANAGANQEVAPSSIVTLTASASYDAAAVNDASYMWEAPDGIMLSDVNAVSPTFTAPEIGRITEYMFKVTAIANVGGGLQTSEAYTFVTVKPNPLFIGEGTEMSPYLINNADDLHNLRLSGSVFKNMYIKLMSDIDLTNDVNFEPIPDMQGEFDGNNKIITGLTIDVDGSSHTGLFGFVRWGGSVKNLGLVNPSITNRGTGIVGAIVGYAGVEPGLVNVENCFVIGGTISGNSRVGGIAGSCANWTGGELTVLKNCYTYTNVTGGESGGLIGASNGGNADMVIEDCAVYGYVNYVGTGDMGPASIDGTASDIILTDVYFKEGMATVSAIVGETELSIADLADMASYPGLETSLWSVSPKFSCAVLSAFDVESLDIALDIENDIKEVGISVYPNPVINTLYINNAAEGSMLQVYSTTGALMMAKEVTSSKVDIDMSTLPTGIYLIKVGNTIERIVKK